MAIKVIHGPGNIAAEDQTPDRTQPVLLLKPGKPKRAPATYKRNGTGAWIVELAIHTGDITHKNSGQEQFGQFFEVSQNTRPKIHHQKMAHHRR